MESLKNMLLVLSTQGLFQSEVQSSGNVSEKEKQDSINLWKMTWEILEYAPFADLFPSQTDSDSLKTIVEDTLLDSSSKEASILPSSDNDKPLSTE